MVSEKKPVTKRQILYGSTYIEYLKQSNSQTQRWKWSQELREGMNGALFNGHPLVMCVFSCVPFFVTPWTVALQPPPSMEFSRQEYWSGLPFPPPGDLPDPWIQPTSLASPAPLSRLGSLFSGYNFQFCKITQLWSSEAQQSDYTGLYTKNQLRW